MESQNIVQVGPVPWVELSEPLLKFCESNNKQRRREEKEIIEQGNLNTKEIYRSWKGESDKTWVELKMTERDEEPRSRARRGITALTWSSLAVLIVGDDGGEGDYWDCGDDHRDNGQWGGEGEGGQNGEYITWPSPQVQWVDSWLLLHAPVGRLPQILCSQSKQPPW